MDTLPLELFNEKVARLEKSNLAVRMANPHYKLQYERIINREWIAADGITPDDVDAFILNLRLLLQDRDGFSIRCLSEIYSQSDVSMEYRYQFDAQRAKLNEHWAHPSVIGKPDHSGNYTNKELFEIIVYGGLAHCDPKFLHEFRLLTSLGFFSAMVFAAFHHTLQVVLSVVKNIRDINTEVIRGISQQSLGGDA
jgi:hypothetical protein